MADVGLEPRGRQPIDAHLDPLPKQRNPREGNMIIKAVECMLEWDGQSAKRREKDTNAPWAIKHSENQYAYNNHVAVEKPQHKLIRQYAATNAAMHDSQMLDGLLLRAHSRAHRTYLWTSDHRNGQQMGSNR